MKTKFTVKAKHFELYEAFKKIVEGIGYNYITTFNNFDRTKLVSTNCLFFSDGFRDGGENGFALSNGTQENNFQLETQFQEAVDFAKGNYSVKKIEEVIYLSVNETCTINKGGVEFDSEISSLTGKAIEKIYLAYQSLK